jgi:hypothetical protein
MQCWQILIVLLVSATTYSSIPAAAAAAAAARVVQALMALCSSVVQYVKSLSVCAYVYIFTTYQ